jgi:hypothetical protein
MPRKVVERLNRARFHPNPPDHGDGTSRVPFVKKLEDLLFLTFSRMETAEDIQ